MANTFIKLFTTILTEEKYDDISDAAFSLYVKALLYAKEHDTYGMVTETKLRKLASHLSDESFKAVILELQDRGLWESAVSQDASRNVTRYGVSEAKWERFQTGRNEDEALRSANAERQKRYRDKKKQVQSVTDNVTNNVTEPLRNAKVTGQSREEERRKEKSISDSNAPVTPDRNASVAAHTPPDGVSLSGLPSRTPAKRGTGPRREDAGKAVASHVASDTQLPRKAELERAMKLRDFQWKERPRGQTVTDFEQAFAKGYPFESRLIESAKHAQGATS